MTQLSLRILMVGPGNNGKYGGAFYYAFHRRLFNGFVRAGHFVFPFSDRDTADYALGVRVLGRRLANQRLLEVARELKPDVVVLLQSDLISPQTILEIRARVGGVKVATVSIDDIGHKRPAAQFRRLLGCSDFGFATTGGELLRGFSDTGSVAFIPNPVDLSIDTEVSYENAAHDFDYFFSGHQPDVDVRWRFVAELEQRLEEKASGLVGGVFGRSRARSLSGADYIAALARAKVGLNLNRRDGGLYASDRMAHYLGNGLLLATHRGSGYGDVFGEDEMLFFSSVDDLSDGLERVLSDDKTWRSMARAGRTKALASMGSTLIGEFILAVLTGEGPNDGWAFSSHIYEARA